MLHRGEWYSSARLAELALAGLPADKRKLNELILADRWASRTAADGAPLHRRRAGKGGGYEWHIALLPAAARADLVRRGLAEPEMPRYNIVDFPALAPAAAWEGYDRLPQPRKAEAQRRLAILQAAEAHVAAGLTKTAAIIQTAFDASVSVGTINRWFSLVTGTAAADWLPALADGRTGGGQKTEIDPELWDVYRSNWLRFEKPTHASCYRRMTLIARARGITILPSAKTLQRKLETETPPDVILACREGRERVAQIFPAQERSTAHLHALHSVNIDGHQWDVMVLWPDGSIGRPITVGIQDLYSRKMLAWRTDRSETAVLTRLAFADLFRNFGIPTACFMDNGRAFASKWISGGLPTRFRFKVTADEPEGLLKLLGIRNTFVTPYSGQSKPIERAWRDFASDLAKCPAFSGAYTGNSVVTKPENYGSRAIPLAEFEAVIAREIAAHNARIGRRGGNCQGRSFDQTYDASVAAGAAIGRATKAQMRLALLAADRVFADRKTGAITFAGNRYWSEGAITYAGQRLTVRFDPDNLHASVFAYDAKGAFIAELPIIEATGFDDMAAAATHAKRRNDYKKAVKASVAAERLLTAAEIERLQAAAAGDGYSAPAPAVIRLVRSRGGTAAARQIAPQTSQITDFDARFQRASGALRLVE